MESCSCVFVQFFSCIVLPISLSFVRVFRFQFLPPPKPLQPQVSPSGIVILEEGRGGRGGTKLLPCFPPLFVILYFAVFCSPGLSLFTTPCFPPYFVFSAAPGFHYSPHLVSRLTLCFLQPRAFIIHPTLFPALLCVFCSPGLSLFTPPCFPPYFVFSAAPGFHYSPHLVSRLTLCFLQPQRPLKLSWRQVSLVPFNEPHTVIVAIKLTLCFLLSDRI